MNRLAPLLRIAKIWSVLATSVVLVAAAPVPAEGYPASGRLAVTAPDQVTALRAGGSRTLFSIALPRGAKCAGDSAHDGYRLYSFLVPHGASPRSVSFVTTLPSKWYGMFTEIEYYQSNLDRDTGDVMTPPNDLTWARFSPDRLIPAGQPAATWDGGVACVTAHDVVQNYWTAGFEFARSPADPEGFTWRVTGAAPGPQGAGSYWLGVAPFLGAAALGGAAYAFHRADRRRRRRPQQSGLRRKDVVQP